MSSPGPEGLLALQDLDVSLDQHRHRLAHLPARLQLAELAARREALDGRRRSEEELRGEVLARQAKLEAELTATERRREEVSARLYGGSVSASRDLQAMAAEVESLSARAAELEEEGLVVLGELEPMEASLADLGSQRSRLDAEAEALEGVAAGAEAELRSEIDRLMAERSGVAASLPAELLATYERLRQRLGGVGAARLVGDRCAGCHLTLPATELDRVRHLPADAVVTCEQCGRILVRTTSPPTG
ncbi:MAG: C4-type zinc ribbon domain-containing protein [Actinomycetota bacterium]|nr:C4-type zinc ribbon domain-containing protein [Actinomycetota bacterium]